MKIKKFIRSIYNLGDYCDHEKNDLPSMTDPTQDEPIDLIVKRLLRGEPVKTLSVAYDSDKSPDLTLPPQARDGFDIADAAPIIERAIEARKALDIPPTDQPAPVPADPNADVTEAKPN